MEPGMTTQKYNPEVPYEGEGFRVNSQVNELVDKLISNRQKMSNVVRTLPVADCNSIYSFDCGWLNNTLFFHGRPFRCPNTADTQIQMAWSQTWQRALGHHGGLSFPMILISIRTARDPAMAIQVSGYWLAWLI